MGNKKDERPVTYRLAMWYGFLFATLFMLYGGVKIILGFLDRNYAEMATPVTMLALGLVLLAPAIAFREMKTWGYYGLLVINFMVVILAAVGYQHYENLVALILSLGAVAALLAPATKVYLFERR